MGIFKKKKVEIDFILPKLWGKKFFIETTTGGIVETSCFGDQFRVRNNLPDYYGTFVEVEIIPVKKHKVS